MSRPGTDKPRSVSSDDAVWMKRALTLAHRGCGRTSPNPSVGAVLVRHGRLLGQGWHREAGQPHAEIEALRDADHRGHRPRGATLYVTLEPCCTHGRTPPCTDAIIAAGIRRVVVGVIDPNPRHAGRGLRQLQRAGLDVTHGVLSAECARLIEPFAHWIVRRTPFVTVKAAMTLDGKIATACGESKWITGTAARAHAMQLRCGADAILVGVNTVLADDPALTVRGPTARVRQVPPAKPLRRIVLDSRARTPLTARLVSDAHAACTTVVVTRAAPARRVAALRQRVQVLIAPVSSGRVPLRWLLRHLGAEGVTHLLVEGGGEVQASFLLERLAHRVAFYYAPKILGGRDARKAVAGCGVDRMSAALRLQHLEWRRLGEDLFLTARVEITPRS